MDTKLNKNAFLKKVQSAFLRYKGYKAPIEQRVLANQKWFSGAHWEVSSAKKEEHMLNPVTNFILSAILNKHADAMDYFPEPNIRPEEADDIEEAKRLTAIVPRILSMNQFELTYWRTWWDKLIHGVGIYGVFLNPSKKNGIGDIDIKRTDILNIYWESGIEDIQQSPFLFVTQWFDKDMLIENYPKYKSAIHQLTGDDALRPQVYDTVDTTVFLDKVLVIDCYYKKIVDGKLTVHLLKYAGDLILDWTEENDKLSKTGLYDHGKYPYVFDILYPIPGQPIGMSIPDISSNPQEYINKLEQCILRNSLQASKVRTLLSDSAKVDEKELLDYENDVIHVTGNVNEEKIKQFQTKPIPNYVMQHRIQKENELKEVVGNRDFTQGATSGGVTAMGAISMLQEAGEKLSRDMNFLSYANYKQIIYFVIELIRQFYTEKRSFRITDDNGVDQFIQYDNSGLMISQIQDGMITYRRPEFDIMVTTQKGNPYNQIKQNSVILQLWQVGMFNPQMIDSSLIALKQMSFDGCDEIISELKELQARIQSQQALQVAQPQMQPQGIHQDELAMLAMQADGNQLSVPEGEAQFAGDVQATRFMQNMESAE